MATRSRLARTTVGALLLAALAFLGWGLPSAPAHADVSDFSYRSWHVDVHLDTDAEGRATAHITETLVAEFPDVDQNRGIVRGLPEKYEGVDTDPSNFTVTDARGDAVPFDIEEDDGFIAVLTGTDEYVHGEQTYVISYTLRDVVLARADGDADEFFWDLMDFEHLQPVAAFSATVNFSDALADHLNGNMRCLAGAAGSTDACAMTRAGTSFEIAPLPLAPRQGLSVAIGLVAGTVAQPAARLPNFTLDALPFIVGGAALAAAGAGVGSALSTRRKRAHGRGTIVAQYDVPDSLPPLIAGPLVGASDKTASAQLVHLAVRGAIRIEDGEPEHGFFGEKPGQPVLRLIDPSRAADPLDIATLRELFPSGTPGEAFSIPKRDEKFGKRMAALQSAGTTAATDRGYWERIVSRPARRWGWISLACVAVLAVLTFLALAQRNNGLAVAFIAMGLFAAVLAIGSIVKQRVSTPAGAEAREYLEGVREFIRVAEADRLRMLQSYTGAERAADGTVHVVHLYERLLPYAMLFGLEKEWTRVLQVAYQEHSASVPLWYPAVGLAGIEHATSTISQFTQSLNSSVSYTSSSSGGSTGGGFAGGGGGGGFSGGR
ncbi:DUF2207 domain-containing protein [Leucobacter japonicus]|uniref:DUF2207 domain-containing protein n=1 Tax=Leucobacter japonicus TaxID=1461259 RepID=UPI0006A7B0A9|nr:DUF2207 domain-containing protein [Leucobacter japonicus]